MAALGGAIAGGAIGYGGAKVLRGGLRRLAARSFKRSKAMNTALSPQLKLFEPKELNLKRMEVLPSQGRTMERIVRNEATDFRNMMKAVKPRIFAGVGAVGGAVTGVRVGRQKPGAPPSTRIAVVTASPNPSTLKNPTRDQGTITTGTIDAKQRRKV